MMCFFTTPNFWSNYDNYSNFFPKTTCIIYINLFLTITKLHQPLLMC